MSSFLPDGCRRVNHKVLNSWPKQVWNPGFTPQPPRTKPVYKVFVNTVFVIPWALFFFFQITKEFSKANFAWRDKARGCKSICQPAPKQKCSSGEHACLIPSVSTVYNLARSANTAVWTFLGKRVTLHNSENRLLLTPQHEPFSTCLEQLPPDRPRPAVHIDTPWWGHGHFHLQWIQFAACQNGRAPWHFQECLSLPQ